MVHAVFGGGAYHDDDDATSTEQRPSFPRLPENEKEIALLKQQVGSLRGELARTQKNLSTLIRLAAGETMSTGGGYYAAYANHGGYGGFGAGAYRGGYGGHGRYDRGFGATGKDEGGIWAREPPLPSSAEMMCKTPQCNRDPQICNVARDADIYQSGQSFSSVGYPCCHDLMFLMLSDVCALLDKLHVPYLLIYGTLLGALRDQDIMPHTQDMDLVVDRR